MIIQTYRKLEVELPECQIRRKIEELMNRIAEGHLDIREAVSQTLARMEPLYDKLQQQRQEWVRTLKQCMEEFADLKNVGIEEKQESAHSGLKPPIEAFKCPVCQ